MSIVPDYSKPLPQSEGPKLHPFRDRKSVIKFVRLLSDVESEGHAHVFKVSIGPRSYALKMFRFYDDEEDRGGLIRGENDLVSTSLFHAHMDPFYNECRAYGRLIERGENGKIAARCYGHTTISAEREEELYRKYGVEDWGRLAGDGQPIRAIVKEFIQDDNPLTHEVAKKILRDLRKMRKMGVYPMDVRARNYKAVLLVDMSIAMTTPHYLFKIRSRWQIEMLQGQDLAMFDSMISDEGVVPLVRALPNEEYCTKLRSQKRKDELAEKRFWDP